MKSIIAWLIAIGLITLLMVLSQGSELVFLALVGLLIAVGLVLGSRSDPPHSETLRRRDRD